MKEFEDKDGNIFRQLTLEELRPKDEGRNDVLLQTIVAGSSEIEHFTTFIVFRCYNCKDERQYEYGDDFKDWRDMPVKKKCDKCNIDMFIHQNTKGQLRKVLMTEQGTTNPINLTGFIYGDDINKIQPGTKLNMNGILRSRKTTPKSLTYQRFFDISRFKLTDEKPIVPSEEEISEFKTMDKTKLIEFLVNRQVAFNPNRENGRIGGFQGRINKYPDSCYSFWNGDSLKILGLDFLINKESVKPYILNCQDVDNVILYFNDKMKIFLIFC